MDRKEQNTKVTGGCLYVRVKDSQREWNERRECNQTKSLTKEEEEREKGNASAMIGFSFRVAADTLTFSPSSCNFIRIMRGGWERQERENERETMWGNETKDDEKLGEWENWSRKYSTLCRNCLLCTLEFYSLSLCQSGVPGERSK